MTRKTPKEMQALRTGPWRLADLPKPAPGAPTVFSFFGGGGGSSMGYELAGFRSLGCCEIDPEMSAAYRENLRPAICAETSIQDFNAMPKSKVDPRLFHLDVLDGSPPCSVFSMAGDREKKWGSKHKFREGQATQRLDDLFMHFVAAAKKLRPKVVIAENVRGMLMGHAKGYLLDIESAFAAAGYRVRLFLLDSSTMGVPQRRRRIFFVAARVPGLDDLDLSFGEPRIGVREATEGCARDGKPLSPAFKKWWLKTPPGRSLSHAHPKRHYFNQNRLSPHAPAPSLMATASSILCHWSEPRSLSPSEVVRVQTFPDDYDFLGLNPTYVMGMSVPPFMIQRIALRIRKAML